MIELMTRSYEFIQFDSYQNLCFLEKNKYEGKQNMQKCTNEIIRFRHQFAKTSCELPWECVDIATLFMKSRFSVNNYFDFWFLFLILTFHMTSEDLKYCAWIIWSTYRMIWEIHNFFIYSLLHWFGMTFWMN